MSPDDAFRATDTVSPSPSDRTSFELNGQHVSLSLPPMTRLSTALRDGLGLTGTKIGCDAGDCGACTVILDGDQVCACLVPLAQVSGRKVRTIEGEGGTDGPTPLQAALHRHGAAQCGICTPGMVMAAQDLIDRNSAPTEAEILDAIGGVLCRCTGYRKIVEAILSLRAESLDPTADPEPLSPVGARLPRLDGHGKISGRDAYGADLIPTDAVWMRVVRSPHAHATFVLGDLHAVTVTHPELIGILTSTDVPVNAFGIYPHLKDQPVLAEGYVRFRGEAVLALVGTREVVEQIRDADLPITWTALAPLETMEAATAPTAPALHAATPDNVLIRGHVERGSIDLGFAAAAVTAQGRFETSFVEHAYIEPEAGYAFPGDRDGKAKLTVVVSTQTPYMDRDEIAHVLGLSGPDIRVIPSACGGGFGGKLDMSVQPLIAVAAMRFGRTVACVYSRTESMAASTKRHPAQISARAAADASGRLLAFAFDGDFNTGAYASWGPTVAGRVPVHATGPYAVPHVRNRSRAIYTNNPPSGAFRGFGVPQAAIAHECLMDDLAQKLGLDPLTFRLRNAIRVGDVTPTGQRLTASIGQVACLEALKPHWIELRAAAEEANADATSPYRHGVGIGCMWYGCGNTSMSNPSEMTVTLGADGTVTLFNGAMEIGQGSGTVMVQICAEALGIDPARIAQVIGDTGRTLDAGKTSASRQTFVSGNAARAAGADLRAKILRLANAGPQARLDIDGHLLRVLDGGETRVLDLSSLAPADGGCVLSGYGRYDPPTTALDAMGQGLPYATYAFGAQICALSVDTELGTVSLKRIVAAHDVGRAINPTLVEGQIHGVIAQGIGLALMEEYLPGRTENLHDYLIPTAGDVPPIDTILIEDPEPEGPFGAKGIGEPALTPTAPAIFGAIRHATGIVVRKAPALPHRLRAALRAAGWGETDPADRSKATP